MEALDILYYVLAFCAIWITAVMCFLLWRVIALLKAVHDTLAIARSQLEKVDQTIDFFKLKIDHGTSHLSGIARNIKEALFNQISR